jgi:hypothetical protein
VVVVLAAYAALVSYLQWATVGFWQPIVFHVSFFASEVFRGPASPRGS